MDAGIFAVLMLCRVANSDPVLGEKRGTCIDTSMSIAPKLCITYISILETYVNADTIYVFFALIHLETFAQTEFYLSNVMAFCVAVVVLALKLCCN